MVNELAVGYVSIVPETSKIGPAIIREFSGVERSATSYGRRIGTQLASGVKAAKPVDVKDLEQQFSTAEKSRAAVIKRTTGEIEGLRRKEAIAQAALTDAESKYSANSVQVLRAKDRLIGASEKVALAEAKQQVEISKADSALAAAKGALDGYSSTASKSGSTAGRAFASITSAAGTMARSTGQAILSAARGDWSGVAAGARGAFGAVTQAAGAMGASIGRTIGAAGSQIGQTMGAVGRGIGDTFRKVASGDIAGAFQNVKSAASTAFGGAKSVFAKAADIFAPLVRHGSKAGSDSGRGFSAAAKPAFGEAGTSAGNAFKSTLGAILASKAITGILGSIKSTISGAFGGGFNRVMNIEQAESKLATLAKAAGLTGQALTDSVAASMKSVGDSVDGTKFAIGDAADMASQLGAAGVKAGGDMTRWLALTADAAQFSGREFGDMQRTISKVVAEGKVTGETFAELPLAAAALAKSLNLPQAEVRKLASEGKITAEQFADAMVGPDGKSGMIGGAAKNAGDLFMSLRDNIKSALNATMAKFIDPVVKALNPVMQAGLSLVKGFRDGVAAPLGAALGEFLQPRAEALAETIGKLPGLFSGAKAILTKGDFIGSDLMGVDESSKLVGGLFLVRDAFVEVRGGIWAFREAWKAADGDVTSAGFAGVMEQIANVARFAFDGVKDAIGGFLEGFGGIDELGRSFGPILGLLTGPLGLLKSVLLEVFKGLDFKQAGKSIGATMKPIVQAVSDLAGTFTKTLAGAVGQLLPVIGELVKQLLPVLVNLMGQIGPVLAKVVASLAPMIAQFVGQLAPVLGTLIGQLLPPLVSLIGNLVPVILEVIGAVLPLVAAIATALIPVLSTIITVVVQVVSELLSGLAPIITTLATTLIPPLVQAFQVAAEVINKVVLPIVTWLAKFLTTVLQVAFKVLLPVVQTVFNAVGAVIKTVVGVVTAVIKAGLALINTNWSAVWNGIKAFLSATWDAIKGAVSAAIGAVKSTVDSVLSGIKGLWERAWGAIRDFASSVWGTVKRIVTDHINAVKKVIADVIGTIRTTWESVWGGIKSIGEKAWNWIYDTATGVFGRLKSGVETTFGKMRDALSTIWGAIKGVFAKPINAVVGFINTGIVGGYNWVADKFGLGKMNKLATIPGYADGGWTGRGSKHTPAGIVHADEWVLTKDEVRRMGGPRGVETWLTHGLSVPGYAGGGRVSYQGKSFTAQFVAALESARRLFGRPFHISQGGFRPRTSYSGTSHQGDAVDITSPVDNALIAALRKSGIAAWDRTGKGKWAPHIHGVPLPGFGSAGGSAVWQAQDYLRGGDGLGGRDNGPRGGGIMEILKGLAEAIAAGFNSVKDWFSAILDKITGPFKNFTAGLGGGTLADLVTGVATTLKDELTKWVKDKLGIGYATGTRSALPGAAWVGEREPELVSLRGGEQITPLSQLGVAGPSGSGPTRLSREDLDYLIAGLSRVLWPAARAADMVNDLAANGQNRARRGVGAGI